MRTPAFTSSMWTYVVLTGAVIPVALVAVFLALGKPEVAGELGILLAVYAALMVLAAYTSATSQAPAAPVAMEVRALAPLGLEWIDTIPSAPSAPVAVRVTHVSGGCAMGYLPGNTWVVDRNGHLSRPLCNAAARALGLLLDDDPDLDGKRQVDCDCPLAEREVRFEVGKEV